MGGEKRARDGFPGGSEAESSERTISIHPYLSLGHGAGTAGDRNVGLGGSEARLHKIGVWGR